MVQEMQRYRYSVENDGSGSENKNTIAAEIDSSVLAKRSEINKAQAAADKSRCTVVQ